MEYRILADELRYPDRVSEKHMFQVRSNGEHYVKDNYAEDDSFGFYDEDLYNALDHAELMIERLNEQKGRNQKELTCLVQDVRNYFYCVSNIGGGERWDVKYLLNALAYFGLHDALYTLVMEQHRLYEEERKENFDFGFCCALDFNDLYIELGDRLLFRDEQPEAAIKMYQLATLEWQDAIGKFDGEKQTYQWMQYYREYQYYLEGSIKRARRKRGENSEDDNCIRLYNDLFRKLSPTALTSDLMVLANQFYEEVRRVMEESRDKHVQRKVLIMAHRVRQAALIYALNSLYTEEEYIQNNYWSLVVMRVAGSHSGSLEIVRQYMRTLGKRSSTNFALYLRILELAGLILRVDEIKHYLRANDGRQDIAYYTSLETLGYMLPRKDKENPSLGKLSVMHVAYMNDPMEGKVLRRYLAAELKDADVTDNGRKIASYPYVFMKCFTTLIDDLPMWEMYGNHATGCCLVLQRKYFTEQDGNEGIIPLYQVCYLRKDGNRILITREDNPLIKDLDRVKNCLDWIKAATEKSGGYKKWYLAAVEDITYLFKDADYNHEQELRIVYQFHKHDEQFQHTEGDYPKLYIRPEFYPKIKEIILGPKFEGRAEKMPYLQEQLEKMCEEIGIAMPVCSMSAIEYR